MRPIIVLSIIGLLVSADVAVALNPQPEPPSEPKQMKQFNVKKQGTSPMRMRRQDLRKLNPQPEPPSTAIGR